MTEAEWLTCTYPQSMLEFLRGKASERKLRLFAVACCRRIWSILVAEVEHWHKDEADFWRRCLDAVELAERFADGNAVVQDLAEVTAYPRPALLDADAAMYAAEVKLNTWIVADCAAEAAAREAEGRMRASHFPNAYIRGSEDDSALLEIEAEYERVLAIEKKAQGTLLRDVLGNPFRPITLDTAWLTPTVKDLAQSIYTERTFDQMPLMANELEKAGCANQEILDHCRGPGTHVKGCWLVDLILRKE
jgi:hypothetical protein